MNGFDADKVLTYLGLESDYEPSPEINAIDFLKQHLRNVPPQLISSFSLVTTPQQRSTIALIRNRCLKYADSHPAELTVERARSRWPALWQGRGRAGLEEGKEEREWAQTSFLDGSTKHIGKLGNLLAEYEEERDVDRVRRQRWVHAEAEFIPEEDESDSEEEGMMAVAEEEETEEEQRLLFERRVRERFIYGLLPDMNYDVVDWNDALDADVEDELQERWFLDDEE